MTDQTVIEQLRKMESRLSLAETKISQLEGGFAFISGQLRDVQQFMHNKFGEIDARFDRVDARLDRIEGRLDRVETRLDRVEAKIDVLTEKVDALPRVIAEIIAKR